MDERTRHPVKITAEDINPRYNWGRHLPVLGADLQRIARSLVHGRLLLVS